MSANTDTGEENARRAAADAVRGAFGALPLGDKLSTLVKIELDMLGDAADYLVSAAERVADDVAQVFTCSDESEGTNPPGAERQASAS
jgi:hypothetical protein